MAGDPMGLASAYGAAGGYHALDQLLARLDLEKQRQAMEEDRAQGRSIQREDLSMRRAHFKSQQDDRLADNARLDRAEAGQTADRKAHEEELIAKTAAEKEARDRVYAIINDPNADPMVKRAATLKILNINPPAEVFRDRTNELEDAKSLARYRASLEAANQKTARDDKAEIKTADNPNAPSGVQSYLLKLRSKYPNIQDAVNELEKAWDNIQQVHPKADATEITSQLMKLYNRPRGVKDTPQLGALNVDNR